MKFKINLMFYRKTKTLLNKNKTKKTHNHTTKTPKLDTKKHFVIDKIFIFLDSHKIRRKKK